MEVFNKLYFDKSVDKEFSEKKLYCKVSENPMELIRDGVQLS